MKKIFTLIAMALVAVGANAQGSWVAPAEAPAAGSRLFNDDLINAVTVYETTCKAIMDENDTPTPVSFKGKTFDNLMQVRVNAAPTAATPEGTEQTGSTPIVIKAKKNVDITVYFRRQTVDGACTDKDGKDCKLIEQSAPGTLISAAEFEYEVTSDPGYAYTMKVFKLEEGKTYTLWGRGTTINLYGIDWAEGTGAGGGGETKVEDGTYFISYNVEPSLSNLTTEEMSNTGTANNVATWDGGFSIMIMRSDKGMSAGSNISIDGATYKTIKVSNGAQNLLTLPEGKVAKGITFYSYVNADDGEPYWKEVAGVTYEADTEGGMKNFKEADGTPDVRTYNFPEGTQLNKITFTNSGKQLCYVIKIDIVSGSETSGVQTISTNVINLNAPMYNLSGQKVSENYKGVVIQNGTKRIQK